MHQLNYCVFCDVTVIKLINFAFDKPWYRDIYTVTFIHSYKIYCEDYNLRKYKYSDSIKITVPKSLANYLNFYKNIRIIESEVNQTQWWSKLIKCFKFCPHGRNTPSGRHCSGRINLLEGINPMKAGIYFWNYSFLWCLCTGRKWQRPKWESELVVGAICTERE